MKRSKERVIKEAREKNKIKVIFEELAAKNGADNGTAQKVWVFFRLHLCPFHLPLSLRFTLRPPSPVNLFALSPYRLVSPSPLFFIHISLSYLHLGRHELVY